MQQPETFTYNEKEYTISDISEKARYLLRQINTIRVESTDLKEKLDRANVAEQAFSNLLGQELETSEKEAEEEYEVEEEEA